MKKLLNILAIAFLPLGKIVPEEVFSSRLCVAAAVSATAASRSFLATTPTWCNRL